MTKQAVQLKRSDKTYLAGRRAIWNRQNEIARELDWLDKNIEILRKGRTTELRKMWQTTDSR